MTGPWMIRELKFPTPHGVGHAELHVSAPLRLDATEFVCEYSLHAVGSPPQIQGIFGVDALQALLLALCTVVADSGRLLRRAGAVPGIRLDDELQVCLPDGDARADAGEGPLA